MLKSFKITTTMTKILKSLPAVTITTCWLHNKVGVNMQLPYEPHFGGAKFDRGWVQLMYGSLMLLCTASRCS